MSKQMGLTQEIYTFLAEQQESSFPIKDFTNADIHAKLKHIPMNNVSGATSGLVRRGLIKHLGLFYGPDGGRAMAHFSCTPSRMTEDKFHHTPLGTTRQRKASALKELRDIIKSQSARIRVVERVLRRHRLMEK